MRKKALIIGVSGQDGAYLAEFLLKKGYEVHGTSRDHMAGTFKNLQTLGIKAQVKLTSMVTSDFRSVLTALQKADADEIYNLSGQTSVGMSFAYPIETFDSILLGTMNLLECIRMLRKSVRFYNAGSSEVFGCTASPATEETPFKPRSPYATAKAAAHYAVANYRDSYGLFAATGILFNHESPLRSERFVTQKIITAATRISRGSNEILRLGNLEIYRDWGWAPDYVDAMWRILQQDTPEDFVISTGEMHALRDFLERAFELVGLNAWDHTEIDTSLFRPSDITHSIGDPAKAISILGWKPTVRFSDLVLRLIKEKELS